MKANDTRLKCTWTNGLIWAGITIALAAVFRYQVVRFCVPAQASWIIGGEEILISFTSDYYTKCLALMMGCIAIPVFSYLFMYRGYMKLAGENPTDLHAVAIGKHGRPWIPALILQIVLSVAWAVVCALAVALGMETGEGFSVYDRIDIEVLLIMLAVAMVFDLLLFLVGKLLFKPDLVQKNN